MSQGRRDDDAARVEELLRVNAALAAEIRSLTQGRVDAPRPAAMPTSRRLAMLVDERDTLQAEIAALRAEVDRLRSGPDGILRRIRARLLGSRRR